MRVKYRVGLFLLLAAIIIAAAIVLQHGKDGSTAGQSVTPQGERPLSLEWGPVQKGVRTRLVPHSAQFILGQPIKFRLEMQNVGEATGWYYGPDEDSMLINGPDGKVVPYIRGPFSVVCRPQPLRPREVVTLFQAIDVTPQYYIVKPGRYTVQFRGTLGGPPGAPVSPVPLPPSNVVTIEVLPSKDGASDGDFVLRLLSVLPKGWDFSADPYAYIQERDVRPAGRLPVKGVYADMWYSPAGMKGNYVWIKVWQTCRSVEMSEQKKATLISEYLGKNQWGHVYVLIPPEAKRYWRDARKQIAAALEVRR